MNTLYKVLNITKQAFHKRMDRQLLLLCEQKQIMLLIGQLREEHPTMGCRDMYYKLQPQTMGRDAFEAFCKAEELSVPHSKNRRRTTDNSGVIRFDNLLENKVLTSINEAWVSDITYYEVQGRFYYLTFIMDAFSRRIIGHATSERLLTEHTTLPALKMALKARKESNLQGLIFHSDGGGQYYDKEFITLLTSYKKVIIRL